MNETILKVGQLIVGDGTLLDNVSILIEGEKIIEIGPNVSKNPETTVIDYSDRVVMPGIIEGHVHVDMVDLTDPTSWNVSDEYRAILGAKQAEYLLQYGVTTFADACSRGNISFAIRDAIDAGHVLGPRMLISGRMLTITGGRAPILDANEADGPDATRKAAREEIARGINFVKVSANSLGLLSGLETLKDQFSMEEMKAATEEAHNVGLPVHSHAYGDTGVRNTILAGVDVVVHGHPLTQHNINLLKEHKPLLMPTLVSFFIDEDIENRGISKLEIKKRKDLLSLIEEGFRNAVMQGIEMVVGSDTGDSPLIPFGPSTMKELEYMVQLGGMSEMNTIVAGTRNAARALNIDSDIGTLEPGKIADILIFKRNLNPLEDITILQNQNTIERVLLKGKTVVKR